MSTPTPIRIGAVGCGLAFERLHLPVLRRTSTCRVAALCDVSAARLDRMRAALPNAACHDDVASMLDETPLDAVLVATPPDSHASIVLAALDAGVQVLVEKPMTTSVADADAVAARSRERGGRVAVGFNRRFRPTVVALKRRLDGVTSIRYELVADRTRWPSVDDGDPVRAVLHDVAAHQVDLVPWLLDRPITAVRCIEARTGGVGTVVDFELALAGGATASCRAGHADRYHERIDVGDGAGYPARAWRRARDLADLVVSRLLRRPNMTVRSIERQLAAFAGGGGEGADVEAGRRAVVAIDACVRSAAADGAWQDVPDE